MEAKGPRGFLEEGMLQACHYGAIGARAMQSLQTYGQLQPTYDNHVRTISSVYYGGMLKMYGHSVAQPGGPGTRPEYYMHQIEALGMTGDQETFLKGATAYKNAIGITAEHRNGAIEHANTIAHRLSVAVEGVMHDDEDSAEDDGGEDEEEEEEEDEVAPVSFPSLKAEFVHSTSRALTEEDNDEDNSETSVEADYRGPPAKRPSTKSQSSSHRGHKSHKSRNASTSKGKQRKA